MAQYPNYDSNSGFQKWIFPSLVVLLVIVIGVAVILFNPFKKPEGSSDNSSRPSGSQSTAGITPSPLLTAGAAPVSQPTIEPNLPKVVQLAASANPQAAQLIKEAMNALNAQPSLVIEARQKLNDVLALPISGDQQKLVKAQLAGIADKWLFSKTIYTDDKLCGTYKVKSGDKLTTIGQQYKVPYEILMQLNNIPRPEALQAGVNIKVINGPFNVKVYRSTFTMDLYCQDTFVKSFKVGIGKPGRETPKGSWVVKPGGKMIQPRWTDPDTGHTYEPTDPDYPLGSRWIALDGISGEATGRDGFAIHGTKVESEIGSATSRGCIRMYNGEVITMYNLLVPTYSKVEVVD